MLPRPHASRFAATAPVWLPALLLVGCMHRLDRARPDLGGAPDSWPRDGQDLDLGPGDLRPDTPSPCLAASRRLYLSFAGFSADDADGDKPSPEPSLRFDGADGRPAPSLLREASDVGLTYAAAANVSSERGTVALWVKSDQDPTAVQGVSRMMLKIQFQDGHIYLVHRGFSDGQGRGVGLETFGGKLTDAGVPDMFRLFADEKSLPEGTWTHLAFTYDSGVRMLGLHVNGVKVKSAKVGAEYYPDPTDPPIQLMIGGSGTQTGPIQTLTGAIDEVMIFDEVLGDPEISALCQHGC